MRACFFEDSLVHMCLTSIVHRNLYIDFIILGLELSIELVSINGILKRDVTMEVCPNNVKPMGVSFTNQRKTTYWLHAILIVMT